MTRSVFRRVIPLILVVTLLSIACASLAPASRPDPTGTAEAADAGLSLTVYNQGTALVRDRRQFDLVQGINDLRFGDVASSIDPTSVLFESLTDPRGTSVLEQNSELRLPALVELRQHERSTMKSGVPGVVGARAVGRRISREYQ